MTERFTSLQPAPFATQPLNAMVTVSGSRSLSNRYLILVALGSKPVTPIGLLRSRDTDLMVGALEALDVHCDVDSATDTTVTVTSPVSGRFHGNVNAFCGLVDTVMRFVFGLILFADDPVDFGGGGQAYARSMKPVLDGLGRLGVTVAPPRPPPHLPFATTLPAILPSAQAQVSIDSSGSSQFASGLLLINSRLPNGLHFAHTGEKTLSLLHIYMIVVDMTGASGAVETDKSARTWTVKPRTMQLPSKVTVESDLSNAAPFLGAALITGGVVRVPYWSETTTQPGGLLPGYLEQMDAKVSFPIIDGVHYCGVTGDGTVHGLDTSDLMATGEITPSLATILVFADKPVDIVDIGHLRGHETNRLEALVNEIRRVRGVAEKLPDGLRVEPTPAETLHGAMMEAYANHRMATFAAMPGLRIPDTRIVNVAITCKTLPDFVDMWSGMLRQ